MTHTYVLETLEGEPMVFDGDEVKIYCSEYLEESQHYALLHVESLHELHEFIKEHGNVIVSGNVPEFGDENMDEVDGLIRVIKGGYMAASDENITRL